MRTALVALIALTFTASCGGAQRTTARSNAETVLDAAFVAFKAVAVTYEAVKPLIQDETLSARIGSHMANAAQALDLAIDAKELKDDELVVQAVACGVQELAKVVDLTEPVVRMGRPVRDRVNALVREVGGQCELY